MRFLQKLEKQTSTWFLIVLCFTFFLLRLPSLFEPLWYGDEGIYEVIGNALRQGRVLYSGIWDNKPPLLYYIYALFHGDQSSVRLLSLLFGIASIIVFFFLSKKLFQVEKITYITTAIFALLFATPLLEGNIANAENFMILPIGVSALVLINAIDKKNPKSEIRNPKLNRFELLNFEHLNIVSIFDIRYSNLFIAGLFLGIAFLIKVVAIFDFSAFFIFLFIIQYKSLQGIRHQIIPLLSFLAGFIMPILLTCLFFLLQGNFGDFIQSAFANNVGYVAYKNAYIIPQGLLVIKLIVLAGFLFFLFFKRSRLSQKQLFILIWLAFSVFNALFSQRPYTHYLLVLLMSSSLYIGFFFSDKKLRSLWIISGIIMTVFLIKNFSSGDIRKVFAYYGNFLQFLFQQKTTDAYRGFFDKATPRDYTLAAYMNENKRQTDTIFVWGNNAQMYKLTNTLPPGRFIVVYHISQSQNTVKETYYALQKNFPRYIITFPISQQIPYSLMRYRERFSFDGTTIYERIF